MKVNSFFCGAGGFDLGFIQAGFEIAGAWDFDKYAVESYKHGIGDHVQEADVTKMTGAYVPNANGWTFGFPCQDISVAGKGRGFIVKCTECLKEYEKLIDTHQCPSCGCSSFKAVSRSGMFFEIMRLLGEVDEKPDWVLAENVKAVKKLIPVIKEEYEKAGYRLVDPQLYNTKYWFLPQNRERYFLLGVKEDNGISKNFTFPEQQTDFIPKLSSILESNVDEKYYIDDIKAAKIIEQAMEGLKVRQATKKGYDIAVEGDTINISHPNSQTRRGRVGKQVAQTLLTGTEQVVVLKDTIVKGDLLTRNNPQRQFGFSQETCFTLRTVVQHGVIEEQPKIEMIGLLDMKGNETVRRVYDPEGLSPTLTTSEGGHRQPKILTIGNTNPSGRGMNGKVYDAEGLAPTVTTNKGEGHKVLVQYRIRKLTPREYARLQGFPDEVFNRMKYHTLENSKAILEKYPNHKGKRQFNNEERIERMSNSQLYKQMGNAVSVTVSHAIAKAIKEQLY